MRIRELSPAIGAEISDIDLSQPVSDATWGMLRHLFDQRGLLCFRNQKISSGQQVEAVRQFGPVVMRKNGHEYSYISNRPVGEAGGFVSEGKLLMHSDLTFTPAPYPGISLYGENIGPHCAPTYFANAARACTVLPGALRQRLEGLMVLQVNEQRPGKPMAERPTLEQVLGSPRIDFAQTVHPMLYRNPRTGVPVLGVNEHHSVRVIGLDPDESEALLQDLFSTLYAPDNRYAHDWQPFDLLLWDNIMLQHGRPETPAASARVLRRVTMSAYPSEYLMRAGTLR